MSIDDLNDPFKFPVARCTSCGRPENDEDCKKSLFVRINKEGSQQTMDYALSWETEMFRDLKRQFEGEVTKLEQSLSGIKKQSDYRYGLAHMLYLNKKILAAIELCKSPSQRDYSLDDRPY